MQFEEASGVLLLGVRGIVNFEQRPGLSTRVAFEKHLLRLHSALYFRSIHIRHDSTLLQAIFYSASMEPHVLLSPDVPGSDQKRNTKLPLQYYYVKVRHLLYAPIARKTASCVFIRQ